MKRKISFAKIFILGLGFFGISIIWSLYNADVPLILNLRYHLSYYLIGWVMNLDNILAITIIPLVGAFSDRINTKIGKRMPFIITALPIGAIFFILLPYVSNHYSFYVFFTTLFLMNFSMAVARAPVIALMPDVVPSEERSPANGIINFMGGFGSLLVYFLLGRISSVNRQLGFGLASLILVVSVIILFISIKEKRDAIYAPETKSTEPVFKQIGKLFKKENFNLLFVLLSILFWFIAFNSVETFYVVYMVKETGLAGETAEKLAKFNLGLFSLSFMIFALPSGYIAKTLKRKYTILTGLFGLIIVFGLITILKSVSLHKYLFIVGGICWALVNINSLPMVLDLGTLETQGTHTGFYYFFSQFANIVAPPLAGFISDKAHTTFVIFPFAIVFITIAIILMFNVKGGEAIENNRT
ncbi:MAG: SLC45 family MFS transporter [Caldisericaceae bacterium]